MSSIELQRELIRRNGFALSMTKGVSMRPLIWEGAHIVVVAPLEEDPSIGDMLAFTQISNSKESKVLHRLVEIREEGGERLYITRGDNCVGMETVRREEIIGRVVEVHRKGGWRPWYVIPRRKFSVNDRSYRCYVRVWTLLWPLRRFFYRIRWSVGRRMHLG